MTTLKDLGIIELEMRIGLDTYHPKVRVTQYDSGLTLEYDIVGRNGEVVTSLPDVVPILYVESPDKKSIGSAKGTITGGKAIIPIPSSLLWKFGEAEAQVQLVNSKTQEQIHDDTFILDIAQSKMDREASLGESIWFNLRDLQEAIATVQQLEEQYDTDVTAVATMREDVTTKHREVTTMHSSLQDVFDTEQERRTAESARISAEADRVEAESARKTAETERQNEFETNEAARENTFEINESVRHQHAEERLGKLEEEYAPKLTEVTAQLAQTPTQLTINSGGKVLFFGHRGASNIAPENTIPAFEHCGRLGWYGAETDIQVTSDGVWVCHHDTTVDRMTNGTGNVNSMTAAELKTLTVDSGANVSQYPNLKNPTFEEYLIACKKYDLMPLAEIKADIDYTAYFKDLIDIVRKHGMEDRMSFICGSFANAESIRYLSKKVIIHVLTNGSTDSLNFVKSLGNAVADIQNINVTAQVVNAHHAIGIPVNTWGMATLSQVIQLIDMGVDYITSDNYGGF